MPAEDLAAKSAADLIVQAAILDGMGLGRESVVVTHMGGVYGDRESSRSRFVMGFERLPEAARRRLVLENDDVRFGVVDTLWVHERTGIPLIFDNLHHRLNNPGGWPARDALAACLATWPQGVRPKIHFSTPRTEWLIEEGAGGENRGSGRRAGRIMPITSTRSSSSTSCAWPPGCRRSTSCWK